MATEAREPEARWTVTRSVGFAVLGLGLLVALYLTSRANYVLFHTLAETFTVVVALSIFTVTYNARRFLQNNYLLVLGIAYLFVASVDVLHALAYKGMGVFPGDDANMPTQLWLVARGVQTLALLGAPLALGIPQAKTRFLVPAFALLTAGGLAAIFVWPIMPTTLDANGLTAFKITSEYLISAALLFALFILVRRRQFFEPRVFGLLAGHIALTVTSELAFTLYSHPYGPANMVGHLLRIVAFYLAYKAIVQTAFLRPSAILFLELQASERLHRQGERQFRHIAEVLQEAMLSIPERLPGVEFGHLYRSATHATRVGGDFYDLFELDDGRVAVVSGDVSGKGLEAATLTARIKHTMRAYALEGHSPASVLERTNRVITRSTDTTSWASIFLGYLDVPTGSLMYCSAGHPPPIVRRAGGSTRGPRTFQLNPNSPIAGAFDETEFSQDVEVLEPGDVLLLYTDGVTEARRGREIFGEERLMTALDECPDRGTEDIPSRIFSTVLAYCSGRLSDDIALVALAITPADSPRRRFQATQRAGS